MPTVRSSARFSHAARAAILATSTTGCTLIGAVLLAVAGADLIAAFVLGKLLGKPR